VCLCAASTREKVSCWRIEFYPHILSLSKERYSLLALGGDFFHIPFMRRFSSYTVACVLFVISMGLLVMFLIERRDNQSGSGLGQVIEKPEAFKERLSYAYGVVAYRQLRDMSHPFSVDHFFAGLKTAEAGGELLMSDNEIEGAIAEAEQAMIERQDAKIDKTDKEKGEAFLAENGKKKGVITTASGLQYEVIKPGDGPMPKITDKVTVHYHGTLVDGTVFDSSLKRGEPVSFKLDQVISGWTEGVTLMPKGAKYRFYLPYDLGYGSRGAGGSIKPYSALIFEIELLDF
jgi:FKBP-type peptidyl-prolyl cis-trans isomerase FklB